MNHVCQQKEIARYNINWNEKRLKTDICILGYCINQMAHGYSPLIIVVGKQRIGKSFFAVWLSHEISRFFDTTFDPVKNTFYDPEDTIRTINDFRRQTIIIDEAGAYLNKTEWYEKITRALDKIVQTQGYLNNTYIFCSPFGSDIAKTFRKHFDRMVSIKRKGFFITKGIPKRYDDMTGKISRPYWIEQVRLKKSAVPADLWKAYDKYSKAKKLELAESVLDYKKEAKEKTNDMGLRVFDV